MKQGLCSKTIIHLGKCLEGWEKRKGPRVGDFIFMKDGTLRRFTHDWDDGIQVTGSFNDQSFHLGESGFASFSGGLDPSVPKENIELVYQENGMPGLFWIWKEGLPGAHRGVNVYIQCRTYKEI